MRPESSLKVKLKMIFRCLDREKRSGPRCA